MTSKPSSQYCLYTLRTPQSTWNRGKNQALVGAIPFCGEYPGPQFEDKFRSANQTNEITKVGGDKMINLLTREYANYGVTYTGKSTSSDCLYFCQILRNKRKHSYLQTYNESFPYLLPFSRHLHKLWTFH